MSVAVLIVAIVLIVLLHTVTALAIFSALWLFYGKGQGWTEYMLTNQFSPLSLGLGFVLLGAIRAVFQAINL